MCGFSIHSGGVSLKSDIHADPDLDIGTNAISVTPKVGIGARLHVKVDSLFQIGFRENLSEANRLVCLRPLSNWAI